jgi:RND family efflux transporter MFP subunit
MFRHIILKLVVSASVVAAALPVPAADAPPDSATVAWREVPTSFAAEATVEALRQATVAAQVQGRVVEVRVDAGDRVRQGDLLMRIDERESNQAVAGAEANVAQAQAQLANARATYERTKNLFAQKFVSQSALDQAQAAYRAADAQMKAASANRGQAMTSRSFTSIKAPLAGVVAERHTELGEMATPGKPLLTLYDPRGLRVVASVPQYKLAELRGAVRAKVEFPDTGKWVDATEVELLPVADARTHVVRARVQLPEDLPGVVPGMFARAHFIVGQAKKLVMPQQAIVKRGELTAAYVLDDKGMPQLRQVRTGAVLADGLIEVLAGLSPGEKVSTAPVRAGIALKPPAGQ